MSSDYEVEYDMACPKCGQSPIHHRQCHAFCQDGWFDCADEDPINYTPGEADEICGTCYGSGVEVWCPSCGCDISEYRYFKGEKRMKIYIASSWKNQHAVELLTSLLRHKGHTVRSFVEKAVCDEGRSGLAFDVEKWINSDDGHDKFIYDTSAVSSSDLVVYIGPSGTDAWAEVGIAWGNDVPVIGLWAKGEPAGLMRRLVHWYNDVQALVDSLDEWRRLLHNEAHLPILRGGAQRRGLGK